MSDLLQIKLIIFKCKKENNDHININKSLAANFLIKVGHFVVVV